MTKGETRRVARRLYMELYDPREAMSQQDVFVAGYEQGHIMTLRKLLLTLDHREQNKELIDIIEKEIEDYG